MPTSKGKNFGWQPKRAVGNKSPSKWWYFVENSSDTRHYGINDEEEFQEECIIPDQQNLAHEIQELCSGDQDDPNIGSSEVLLDNISQEFSSKEKLGKPVSVTNDQKL